MALIIPEDLERSYNRVRCSTYDQMLMEGLMENKDESSRQKIMELFEEKWKKYAREDALAAQFEKRKKLKRSPKVEEKKKKKSERVSVPVPIVSNQVTQPLKQQITNEMNGEEVKVVIQKPLFHSDSEKSQNRLNMPINQVKTQDFMQEDEERVVKGKGLEVELRNKFARKDALAVQVKRRKKPKRPTKEKKKKKKKRSEQRPIRLPIVSNQVTQRLKEYISNEMNGKEVKMVIQKPLFQSDLKRNQNRLSMPINQLNPEEFLTEEEIEDLDEGKEFEVRLLGPRLKIHRQPMVLTKWKMAKSDNYVLKTNWNNFVKENEEDLKEKSMIQVWSFRKDEQLHFAIACLENDVDVFKKEDPFSPPIGLLPPID